MRYIAIIMDQQHKQLKSIEEVQEAETYATEKIVDAEKEKAMTIAEAREKAASIIADAISESRQKRDSALKRFTAELEEGKKKAIEKALKESKSIRARRLSLQKREEVVNRLVKIMVSE